MDPMSPPPYPPAPKKQGLSPLAWAGIGCGGVTILAIIFGIILGAKAVNWAKKGLESLDDHPGRAAATAVLAAYPSIGKSRENLDSGTLTLQQSSGGSSVDTNYDAIVHGRVEIPDASGTPVRVFQGDLTKVPLWVPHYPGATGETSVLHEDLPARIRGMIAADTTDGIEAIDKFFEQEADKLFSSRSSARSSADFNGNRTLNVSYSSGKRKLEIHAYGPKGAPMTVLTTYTEEK